MAVRAVHYASALLLFGEFVFFICIAGPVFSKAADSAVQEKRALHARLLRVAACSLAAAVATHLLWLAVEAAAMSGTPLADVLNPEILGTVLGTTLFGHVWSMRMGFVIALCVVLFLSRRRMDDHSRIVLDAGGGLLAGLFLATLAWTGHAAAGSGGDRNIHLLADAAHLLAAGAWIGALPPLIFTLARAGHAASPWKIRAAAGMTQRFSILGMVSVSLLILTGAVNTWYLAGSVPALVGTQYGRLLLVKLALFAAMLALAAVNRQYWMPRLQATADASASASPALRRLRRNAIAEAALGFLIVAIVGALGITIPALHAQPVWPFAHTLDREILEQSRAAYRTALAAGAVMLIALLSILSGAAIRRRWMMAGGLAAFVSAAAVILRLLAVPAFPTTYFHAPLRYAADSIARGAQLYARNCTVCHGPQGRGDGPAAASLSVRPANLAQGHLLHHTKGTLYWWIGHGIAGTPMPGFGDRMSESQIWDVIHFLRARAEAEQAHTMTDRVEPWRPVVAPDFAFQIGHGSQESLRAQRGHHLVLLVLCTLPESLARLHALSASKRDLERAGVRIVAIPMNGTATLPAAGHGIDASIIADSDAGAVATYRMFGGTASGEPAEAPAHIEFLIDRQGYLRARWLPSAQQGWGWIPRLLDQVAALNREPPRPPAPEGHQH